LRNQDRYRQEGPTPVSKGTLQYTHSNQKACIPIFLSFKRFSVKVD